MIETENYTCPARKTDLDSNNITVRNYLSIRKNVKKFFLHKFIHVRPINCLGILIVLMYRNCLVL